MSSSQCINEEEGTHYTFCAANIEGKSINAKIQKPFSIGNTTLDFRFIIRYYNSSNQTMTINAILGDIELIFSPEFVNLRIASANSTYYANFKPYEYSEPIEYRLIINPDGSNKVYVQNRKVVGGLSNTRQTKLIRQIRFNVLKWSQNDAFQFQAMMLSTSCSRT